MLRDDDDFMLMILRLLQTATPAATTKAALLLCLERVYHLHPPNKQAMHLRLWGVLTNITL